MAEKITFDPGKSDVDLVNVLALHNEILLRRCTGTSEKRQLYGELYQPIALGTKLPIKGERRPPTVESISEDRGTGKIQLTTRRSTYELIVPNNEATRLSLRYFRWGFLNFHERMPDGFTDAGRTTTYTYDPDMKLMEMSSRRETMLVDARVDTHLQACSYRIAQVFQQKRIPVEATKDRALLLSQLIAEYYGGQEESVSWRCEEEVSKFQKGNLKMPVPIGVITPGSCRYRAAMYKYQADRHAIPCRLVRGRYGGGHAWNVIKADETYYLLDPMLTPTNIIPTGEVSHYRRFGARGEKGGVGGDSIITFK